MKESHSALKWPAILMIAAAVISAVCSLLWLFAMARLMFGDAPPGSVPIAGEEKLGYQIGQVYSTMVAVISLLAAPYIVNGGLRMLKAKQYNTARTAAILALVPLSSCCFVIGMPVGLWALSVLSKSAIKESFSD